MYSWELVGGACEFSFGPLKDAVLHRRRSQINRDRNRMCATRGIQKSRSTRPFHFVTLEMLPDSSLSPRGRLASPRHRALTLVPLRGPSTPDHTQELAGARTQVMLDRVAALSARNPVRSSAWRSQLEEVAMSNLRLRR